MTVVLVHGNPETPAVWDLMAERLREQGHREPVRLAPPGFGAPLPAGFKPSPVAYRDWLAGQLEVIGEPVDLVGHDWGGLHVAGVAMHRPDLLRSWVSDTLGVLDPGYEWHPLARQWQTPADGEAWVEAQLALSQDERAAGLARLGIDRRVARSLAAGFDPDMGTAILALYRAATQPVMAELGAALETAAARPGLAVVALADGNVGTVAQRRGAAGRAGARIREINAGHWWMAENDGREAADMLTAFWGARK
jgi:pimeloyl-ACP methyl ester carboxylesterase